MSFITGSSLELIYANVAQGTAKNTFTTEVSVNDTAGMGPVAHIPVDFWQSTRGIGAGIRVVARGIISSTATPTFTFTCRLGAVGSITAAIILGSAALTTVSGAASALFCFEGDVIFRTLGAAGANSTVQGVGMFNGGAGFASPFSYALYGGAATPGTVATVDTSITNFINFNVACSASSASNGVTLQQLLVFGF